MPGIDILEETLLVEVGHEDVGKNHRSGKRRQMFMSRKAFKEQGKDCNLTIIKIIKPEGVTMEQHLGSAEGAVADFEHDVVPKEALMPTPEKAPQLKLTPGQKGALTRKKNKAIAEAKAKAKRKKDMDKAAKDLKIGESLKAE